MRPGDVVDVLPAEGQGCPCPLAAGTVWHQGLFADGHSQRSGICKPLRGVIIVKSGMISCACPHPSKAGPAEIDPQSSVMGDTHPHATDVPVDTSDQREGCVARIIMGGAPAAAGPDATASRDGEPATPSRRKR